MLVKGAPGDRVPVYSVDQSALIPREKQQPELITPEVKAGHHKQVHFNWGNRSHPSKNRNNIFLQNYLSSALCRHVYLFLCYCDRFTFAKRLALAARLFICIRIGQKLVVVSCITLLFCLACNAWLNVHTINQQLGCFNVEMLFYQYGNFHYKDKTVSPLMAIAITRKVFILRQGAAGQCTGCHCARHLIRSLLRHIQTFPRNIPI